MNTYVKPGDRIILGGDFNLPNVNWSSMSHSQHSDTSADALLDIVFHFDLSQIVEEPTRIQGTSKSILDLFFLSGDIVPKAQCEVLPGISDHCAVLLDVVAASVSEIRKTSTFPNFSKADDVSILDVLSFHFDDFSSSTDSIHTLWDRFKQIVSSCMHFVPDIVKKRKNKNPWISRETLKLRRRIKRLKKRKSCSTALYCEPLIADLSSKVKNQVVIDKKRYYGESLPNFITASPEKFWRAISPKSLDCETFEINGEQVTDFHLISNAFNDHFKSVFTKDDGGLPFFDVSLPCMPNLTIAEEGIFSMLLKLNVKKSSGPDNIPNSFLQRYAEWVSKYLHVLFTKSLNDGALPDDWVTARIKPLHKSGKKDCINNYRPISLTSTTCKLLEHIIHNQMLNFLDAHNFLSKSQHGFRKGFSTCTQLVETIHDFSTSINNRTQIDAIFMDFSKAFDKVSHTKLLHKVHKVFKNNQLTAWIAAYLTYRKQFVSFRDSISSVVTVDSGVPQGSVLGPLLFLIYINDIVHDIPVNIKLFADDCVLYNEINTKADQILLNSALQKVASWCHQWQMVINSEKTVFMRITHRKKPLTFDYNINNTFLSEVSCCKYLGLWISNDLKWNTHINYVISNANRKLFFLRRALKLTTPSVRLLAYKSVVLPILDYAVMIWDPHTKTNLTKLEKVQRRAARFIYNTFTRTSVTELLKRTNLPSLAQRNRCSRLKFLYQLIKGHYKIDITEIISFSSGYATRQRHSLTITPFSSRNNCFKYSFFPRTIIEWNNLNDDVVCAPTSTSFLSSLQ